MINSLLENTNSSNTNLLYSSILDIVKLDFKFNAKVINNKLVSNNLLPWKDIKPSNFSNLNGGTYLFEQSLDKSQYIGSASNFSDRIKLHKSQFKGVLPKSLHILQKDLQNTLNFSILHETPNFVNLFRSKYPKINLTQGEYDILSALTLYINRILEQSLINDFQPSINGRGLYSTTVYHKFTSWDPSKLTDKFNKKNGTISVSIYNIDGDLEYTANSLNEARKFLDMSYSSVNLYINNTKPYYSSIHNKNFLIRSSNLDHSLNMSNIITTKSIEHKLKNTEQLKLNDQKLTDLSILFLYCFDCNKNLIYTFFTITEIFSNLFPEKTKNILKNKGSFTGPYSIIRMRINLESPILAEDGNIYYIGKNPCRKDTTFREKSLIWLINVNLMEGNLYSNLKTLSNHVSKLNNDISLRILDYHKDTGRIYKNFIIISHIKLIKLIPSIKDITNQGISQIIIDQNQLEILKNVTKI